MTPPMTKAADNSAGTVYRQTVDFRWILPFGTTTARPVLQQAWQSMDTGAVEWRTVETVLVGQDVFADAHKPGPGQQ